MRHTPAEHTPSCSDETSLRRALEQSGWRFTRQRAAVHDYLRSVDCHPTAEEVYVAVRRDHPKISLATVYKALEALVDCKHAAKLTYSDGPARYDCRTDAHYHLRCLATNRVRDLPVTFDPDLVHKLDERLVEDLRQQGFEVTGYRLEVLGHFGAAQPDAT
jgi:Fur family transcriptional regulator, peroxide stress response regulator